MAELYVSVTELMKTARNSRALANSLGDIVDFQHIIDDTPTADVAEVVRCRNCKYHHSEQEPCHGKTEHFCSVLNAQVFKDFYCYRGAKIDGKGDGDAE